MSSFRLAILVIGLVVILLPVLFLAVSAWDSLRSKWSARDDGK